MEETIKRVTCAVTLPGGFDAPSFREWAEAQAREGGFTGLKWSEETDRHGLPMGRLTGVK